jgi:hypothetical protein
MNMASTTQRKFNTADEGVRKKEVVFDVKKNQWTLTE